MFALIFSLAFLALSLFGLFYVILTTRKNRKSSLSYIEIDDAEMDADSPIAESLMTRIRDNVNWQMAYELSHIEDEDET